MTGLLIKQPTSAKDTDYSYGRHQQWECVAHEQEAEHRLKTGTWWTYDYRRQWLERYFTVTSYNDAHTVRECGVCAAELADGMLLGDVGRKATQELKDHLRSLTRKLAGKLGAGKRHIDRV